MSSLRMANASSPSRRLCLRFIKSDHIQHIIFATQVYTGPFMDAGRDDVEDTLGTCRGDSPGL